MTINKDFPVYDYQVLLRAYSLKSDHERIKLTTKILVDFLYKNKLLQNINPYTENGEIKDNLSIMYSNLTPEGVELFKKAIPNWYQAHNRGTSPEKITILEKGLKKIRNKE